jgi:hypothetical protein
MIRHYNHHLSGFSLGEHGAEICFGSSSLFFSYALPLRPRSLVLTQNRSDLGSFCKPGPLGWDPSRDQLNAALSGSLAINLPHQVRGRLRSLPFSIFLALQCFRSSWLSSKVVSLRLPSPPEQANESRPEKMEALATSDRLERPLLAL